MYTINSAILQEHTWVERSKAQRFYGFTPSRH